MPNPAPPDKPEKNRRAYPFRRKSRLMPQLGHWIFRPPFVFQPSA